MKKMLTMSIALLCIIGVSAQINATSPSAFVLMNNSTTTIPSIALYGKPEYAGAPQSPPFYIAKNVAPGKTKQIKLNRGVVPATCTVSSATLASGQVIPSASLTFNPNFEMQVLSYTSSNQGGSTVLSWKISNTMP